MGLEPSDCPLPCSIVSTEAKLASTFDSALGFGLHFMKTAEVTSDKTFPHFFNLSGEHNQVNDTDFE